MEPVQISEEDKSTLASMQEGIDKCLRDIGLIEVRAKNDKEKILEQLSKIDEHIQGFVNIIRMKSKIPPDWPLDVQQMAFVPPPHSELN